jgi:prepilin-type N-terminal cleavage/methylation domain-containing protein
MKLVRDNSGLTLVELIVTALIFGVVLAVINNVFFSTNTTYTKTSQRADMGMNVRLGLSIMSKELRSAGCDPTGMGIVGIVQATGDSIRVRADLDGDGNIQTAEPSEDVLYFFDPNVGTLFRDPGTGPQVVVQDVTGLTLTYFDADNNVIGPPPLDAAQSAQVRSIGLSITTETMNAGQLSLGTTVSLRNG